MRRVFQLNPHFDIHTKYTNLHADRQTDRQTDRHTLVSTRMYACIDEHIRANMRTSKLEVRSKKLEVRNKKWPHQASCISLVGPFIIFNIEVRS